MINSHLVYLIGYWLGDGCYRENSGKDQISLYGTESDFERVNQELNNLGYENRCVHYTNKTWEIIIRVAYLDQWRKAGLKLRANSRTKELPTGWETWPRICQLRMFEGLIDSDGTVANKLLSKSGTVTYVTIGQKLGEQVRDLSKALGYDTGYGQYKYRNPGREDRMMTHVWLRKAGALAFIAEGTLQAAKQERLRRLV